jgi:hypothetical protein
MKKLLMALSTTMVCVAAHAAPIENGLTLNGLTLNGISPNGLTLNGLTA